MKELTYHRYLLPTVERLPEKPGVLDGDFTATYGYRPGLAVVIVGTYHAYTDEQIPSVLKAPLPIFRFVTGPMPATLDEMALHVASTGFGAAGAVTATSSKATL